jgi:lactonase
MSASPLGVGPGRELNYNEATRGWVPVPVPERELLTVTAEPYFKVSDGLVALEGPAYDRQGNLLFVDIHGGRILCLTPAGTLTTVHTDATLRPAGIAIHKDGRIFVAGIGDDVAGRIIALDCDGRNLQTVVPATAGYVPDDLVFDRKGGFYFTDLKGTSTTPTGGVYHVSPDLRTVTAILPNMSSANGVALSPDERVLWATEFCTSCLHRVELQSSTAVARFGTSIPYRFVGHAPDSMRADVDGNVYVAMYLQGRVLVFSPNGIPIGQILLPGREKNHFLKSTSLAFVPGSRDVVIVARDEVGGGGSMIFRARGFAEGVRLFSHQ